MISAAAQTVLKQELDLTVDLENFNPAMLMLDSGETLRDPKLQLLRSRPGISRRFEQRAGRGHRRAGHDSASTTTTTTSRRWPAARFPPTAWSSAPVPATRLGAIAHGAAANLIHRAAEVHLKERRKLILVPRETPLSLVQIENMKRAAEAGAVILPAMPGLLPRRQTDRRPGRFRRLAHLRPVGNRQCA